MVRCVRSFAIGFVAAAVIAVLPSSASATTIVVSSHSNIFQADPAFGVDVSATGPAILSLGIAAPAGTTMTVSASGTTNPGCGPVVSADGDPTIVGCSLPLQGIFLTPAGPFNFASANDFTTSFTSVSPALGQLFFIGDGIDNVGAGQTGATQVFNVPVGATSLALGFIDAPGYFGDNVGAITLDVTINIPTRDATVPEPASMLLLGSGLTAIARRVRSARAR